MPSLVKDKDVIATGTQTLLEDMQNGKKKKKKKLGKQFDSFLYS